MRTSEVAKEAGVSEGIIFHHFKNKRGLLIAVAARHGHNIATTMFSGILPGQRPDIHGMIRRVFEYCRDHGKLQDMIVMAEDPADANAAMHASREVIVAALTQAFRQWVAAGYIETARPEVAAVLLYGLVHSGLSECFSFGQEERMEDFVDEAVACIEGALGYDGADG